MRLALRSAPLRAALAALAMTCCQLPAGAVDAVEPEATAWVSTRGADVQVLAGNFYQGTTLRLTNCVAYAGTTTNSAKQGLDGVTVQIRVGSTDGAQTYTGTVAGATSNGSWWANVVVPTNAGQQFLQLKLIDSQTNSYIYPWASIRTKSPL